MKAVERISDVIGALQMEDQPCRRVQHRLVTAQEVGWDADQHAVAVVQPGVHQIERRPVSGSWSLARTDGSGEVAERRNSAIPFAEHAFASIGQRRCQCPNHGRTTLG